MGVLTSNPKALLAASTGGHLAQLFRLRQRFPVLQDADLTWVTFDSPQSRSLLMEEDVRFVPFTAPRDMRHVATNTVRARSILREVEPDMVISTGSAIALCFLPLASRMGMEAHYIESAARGTGPSMTGRLLARNRDIHLYTQYEAWSGDRWSYRGSVFDAWEPAPRTDAREVKHVLVTLGTLDFSFRRLVERLVEIIPDGVNVTWQTGTTDISGLGIDGRPTMPAVDFSAAVALADVVVAHSGCGSAISALEAGTAPVLVPREHRFGEHIDDHQAQIAAELSARGLAVTSDVENLTWEHLVTAGQSRVRVAPPIGFNLEGDDGVLRPQAVNGRFRPASAPGREGPTPLPL